MFASSSRSRSTLSRRAPAESSGRSEHRSCLQASFSTQQQRPIYSQRSRRAVFALPVVQPLLALSPDTVSSRSLRASDGCVPVASPRLLPFTAHALVHGQLRTVLPFQQSRLREETVSQAQRGSNAAGLECALSAFPLSSVPHSGRSTGSCTMCIACHCSHSSFGPRCAAAECRRRCPAQPTERCRRCESRAAIRWSGDYPGRARGCARRAREGVSVTG